MKITETIERECCQPQDLKPYLGKADSKGVKFCVHCGQARRSGHEYADLTYSGDELGTVVFAQPPMDAALDFLRRCDTGQCIVPSSALGELLIANTRACTPELFYAEPGGGLGWAIVPAEDVRLGAK